MQKDYNILLVLVGGTICTSSTDGLRVIDDEKSVALLVKNFSDSDSKFANLVDFGKPENIKRFKTLSENMTIGKWNAIIDYLSSISFDQYNGVIFAHGTDTLAYSASLLSLYFNSIKIPVFLVASQAPLDDTMTNGNENFKYAVECICRGIPAGVYVTYQNNDGRMYLHKGAHLRQCSPYDENFYSGSALDISGMKISNLAFVKGNSNNESATINIRSLLNKRTLADHVLQLSPYVGINYEKIDTSKYKAIIHQCFHSGTVAVDTDDKEYPFSALSLIDKADMVYFTPIPPLNEVNDQSIIEIYESTDRLLRYVSPNGKKARFIYGMTNEMSYVKLLVACSIFDDANDIEAFMRSNICGEYYY